MASTVTARAPAWADGIAVSGAEMRAAIEGPIWANAGIVRGLAVVQIPTPAMQVRVPAGLCVVDDGQNGFIPLELAAQTDLDVSASSPTLPRIDSVIAEFVDNGASSVYRYRVVAGTPNASPVQPTLPYADQPTGKTLRLYNIAVAALATTVVNANISLQASTALMASYGRVKPVSSDGARPASPVVSEKIWRTDKLTFEVWTGSAWVEQYVATVGNAWKTYTPSWTSAGTAPSLGNGTVTGRYMKVGRTVHVSIELTAGSTTTYGTSSYRLSLPFTAATSMEQFLGVRYFDTSGGTAYMGQATLSVGTYAALQSIATSSGALAAFTNAVPVAAQTGDKWWVSGTYEATS